MLYDFDAIAESAQRRPPHGRAHRVSAASQICDHGAAEESGCAGDQHPFFQNLIQDLPRTLRCAGR
jgi:hypothetical protein